MPDTAAQRPLDAAATGRAIAQAQMCLDEAQKHLNQHRYDNAAALAECAVTWIKAVLPDEDSSPTVATFERADSDGETVIS